MTQIFGFWVEWNSWFTHFKRTLIYFGLLLILKQKKKKKYWITFDSNIPFDHK